MPRIDWLRSAQQHLGVGRGAEHQGRGKVALSRVLEGAGVAEIPVSNARAGEKENLQEPVQRDGDLAEKERAVEIRRQQHVVEHQECQRQDGRNLHDVHDVGQRREAPFVLVKPEDREHAGRIEDESRQQQQEQVPALREAGGFEADEERRQHRHDRRHEVVRQNQGHA